MQGSPMVCVVQEIRPDNCSTISLVHYVIIECILVPSTFGEYLHCVTEK